jgi:2'-5' RNA ligase
MKIRTFIALEIPDNALDHLLKVRDTALSISNTLRWESKDKLHLTLKFLGECESEMIENLCEALEKIVLNYNQFKLKFSKFGIFTKDGEPKILWVGLEENIKLYELVQQIENTFSSFGFQKESRKFSAHITLFRFRGREDAKKILSLLSVNLPEINFTADKVSFMQSKLFPSGSIYSNLKSFKLKN